MSCYYCMKYMCKRTQKYNINAYNTQMFHWLTVPYSQEIKHIYIYIDINIFIYIFSSYIFSSIENCKRSCFLMIWVHLQLFKHALFPADEFRFPTSPCVKSELSSLPGSLRSKAPEHFSDLVRHLSFFFFFFFRNQSELASEGLAKQVRRRILKGSLDSPPRFQHRHSHRCIYTRLPFGDLMYTHLLSSFFFFSLVPQRKHLPSIIFDEWHDSPSLCSLHIFLFCYVQ